MESVEAQSRASRRLSSFVRGGGGGGILSSRKKEQQQQQHDGLVLVDSDNSLTTEAVEKLLKRMTKKKKEKKLKYVFIASNALQHVPPTLAQVRGETIQIFEKFKNKSQTKVLCFGRLENIIEFG